MLRKSAEGLGRWRGSPLDPRLRERFDIHAVHAQLRSQAPFHLHPAYQLGNAGGEAGALAGAGERGRFQLLDEEPQVPLLAGDQPLQGFDRFARAPHPSEQILAALEERQADLVILGTHGRKGFERLMLGSVATGVMHHAACNLLIVPPGARLQNAAWETSEAEMTGADRSFVSDEVTV